MADGPDKLRIVIAALEPTRSLQTALIDLGNNRISPEDLCLAGSRDALGAAQRAIAGGGSASAPYLPLASNVEPLSLPVPETALLATSDRLLTKLKSGSSAIDREQLDSRCWLAYPLRTGLLDRMTRGDVLLLAGPLSSEHMKLGTRVLLQHSRFPVQSHEFLAPAAKKT